MASLMDLMIKIGVSDNASGKIQKVANTTKSAMKGAASVAKGAMHAITAVGTAVGVASGALVALGKQSVSAYADYEQLVGGVEKLFKDSAPAVMKFANDAFSTAGLSANDYMETVTSFSASLIQSVGGDTAKAAEYANRAVVDMADNANKMGSSIESIQNAYQGFAKQNYTMLDNLKLGYGGTKSEMERLLADAGKISGKKFDLKSYADVVEAIHTIQTQMEISGLTYEEAMQKVADGEMTLEEATAAMGTTAKEAQTTITGSFSQLKATWKNFLTGLGDSKADMKALTKNLVNSAKTVMKNVKPVAKNFVTAFSDVITEDAPAIINDLVTGIADGVPELLSTGSKLLSAIGNGIFDNADSILSAGTSIVHKIAEGITQADGSIGEKIGGLVGKTGSWFSENSADLVQSGLTLGSELVHGAIQGMQNLWAELPNIWQGITEGFKNWKDSSSGKQFNEDVSGILQDFGKNFATNPDEAFSNIMGGADGSAESAGMELGKAFFTGAQLGYAGVGSAIETEINGFPKSVTIDVVYREVNKPTNISSTPKTVDHNAIGLDYVPYNGFLSSLHRGEAILTRSEAEDWRNGGGSTNTKGGVTIVQNISATPQTPVQLASATAAYFEQARWAF